MTYSYDRSGSPAYSYDRRSSTATGFDIEEAVDYYWQSFRTDPDGTICFNVSSQRLSLASVLHWDKYSEWGAFSPGELVDVPVEEARRRLTKFRGAPWASRALGWIEHERVPPIVIVDGKEGHCIGDGRGRVNLAVAFHLPALEATLLKEHPDGKMCFTFEGYGMHRTAHP